MRNITENSDQKGKELFISNYPFISHVEQMSFAFD
jgi:hypothetical protein